MIRLRDGERALPPVRANVGIRARFRRRLERAIEAMHRSVVVTVSAAYRATPPEMAQDTAAADLARAVRELRRRWIDNFDQMAEDLGEYFAQAVQKRSDAALRGILATGGFAVRFRMTRAMRDVLNATIAENVSLIKSIPARYLDDVEQSVMRSVQQGRNLAPLAREITRAYGKTKKRAAFIALHQNNMATGAMVRDRQLELGLTDAIWMHSYAGKKPRPCHVEMDGKRFKIAKGMYDRKERRWVYPGELIHCRCTSRPIISGVMT